MMKIFARLRRDPQETVLAGKGYRLAHSNGLCEASFNFTPDQKAEFNRRAAEIEAELTDKIDALHETMDDVVTRARGVCAIGERDARHAARAAKAALFRDFFQLPEMDELTTRGTPEGEVVHLTEAAIIPAEPRRIKRPKPAQQESGGPQTTEGGLSPAPG